MSCLPVFHHDANCNGDKFVDRIAFLKEKFKGHPKISIVEVTKCTSPSHLEEFSKSLLSLGAEGVMLRAPKSPYEVGRSSHFRKYKVRM